MMFLALGVDELVVGHACAGRWRSPPGRPGSPHQTRHPEQRITAEHLGVEEIVVDAAVDHIHGFQTTGAAHPDPIVFADQIAALHQLDAHLLGQVAVLEVGAVEHPGSEHHHGGGIGPGSQFPQSLKQLGGVVVDRLNGAARKEAGEHALHDTPVLQEVGHFGGTAGVVL